MANLQGMAWMERDLLGMQQQQMRTLEGTFSGIKLGAPKADVGLMQLELQRLESTFSGIDLGKGFTEMMGAKPSALKAAWAGMASDLGPTIMQAIITVSARIRRAAGSDAGEGA